MFTRPPIKRVIEDQIYEAQRALIDSAAKVEHAKAKVAAEEANQTYLEARLATLQAQLSSMVEQEIHPGD